MTTTAQPKIDVLLFDECPNTRQAIETILNDIPGVTVKFSELAKLPTNSDRFRDFDIWVYDAKKTVTLYNGKTKITLDKPLNLASLTNAFRKLIRGLINERLKEKSKRKS